MLSKDYIVPPTQYRSTIISLDNSYLHKIILHIYTVLIKTSILHHLSRVFLLHLNIFFARLRCWEFDLDSQVFSVDRNGGLTKVTWRYGIKCTIYYCKRLLVETFIYPWLAYSLELSTNLWSFHSAQRRPLTRAFSLLNRLVVLSHNKNLLRHYAKWALKHINRDAKILHWQL